MSSTTLMTFILQTPPSTGSVDLLGSWDNFSKPYPMQKDLRTGRGHWRGCHTFENIICDGEPENSHQKRDGCLKMGGKYWYFYQLNGDVEYHNPAEPSTTSCPLLPGQPVNVLEVPIQIGGEEQRPRNGSTSSGTPASCTMNPDDKYLNPRPAPVPKLSCFTTSSSSLHNPTDRSCSPRFRRSPWSSKSRTESSCSRYSPTLASLLSYARKTSRARVSRSLSPKRGSMARAALRRFRAPLSAGAASETDRGRCTSVRAARKVQIGEPVLISRTDKARRCIPLREAQPESSSRLSSFSVSPVEERVSEQSHTAEPRISRRDVCVSQDTYSCSKSRETSSLRNSVRFEALAVGSDDYRSRGEAKDFDIDNTVCPALLEAPSKRLSQAAHSTNFEYPTNLPRVATVEDVLGIQASTATQKSATIPSLNISNKLKLPNLLKNAERPQLLRSHFSAWSNNTIALSPTSPDPVDDHTSPSLTSATDTSGDPLSPYRLSFHFDPPTSPDLDGLFNTKPGYQTPPPMHPTSHSAAVNDNHSPNGLHISMDEPTPYLDHTTRTFQSYRLPAHDHASNLTLRKTPTPAAVPEPSVDAHNRSTGLVQSWNDGSAYHLSATEELLEDLAYLGGMIAPN